MNGYKKQDCACLKKKDTEQKLQWMKLKGRNQKQKERNSEIQDNNTPSTNESSTERVRKHRENKS